MNLLMQENGATTKDFVDKAYRMAQESDDEFVHHLIKMVARKHVISNDEIDFKQLDKLATPIRSSGKLKILFDKRQLLLMTGSLLPENDQS